MTSGNPPWKRTSEPVAPVVEVNEDDSANGWTPEALSEYHTEREAKAMRLVADSMAGRLRPRPKFANSKYSPLRWSGRR